MAVTTTKQQREALVFDEFAVSSWAWLYRTAYLLTGNHTDAEDLAQQSLLQAYRSWARVTRADEPRAYLRRMMTNLYISQRRPRSRRLEVLTDAPPEPTANSAAGEAGQLEDRMILWPHIASLPSRQRAVIVLRYYEQLSEKEIAEALGCSTGNVKSTAHRALNALRAAVGPETTEGEEG